MKKSIICICLAMLFALLSISAFNVSAETVSDDMIDGELEIGDINQNGKIDMTDYILLKRAYFGTYTFSEEQNLAGDINQNSKIDMTDYILLKRVYFGTYKLQPEDTPDEENSTPEVVEPENYFNPLCYFNQVVANENSATAWLYDINGDGISELLIEGGTMGTYVEIYAFQNDEVVCIYENGTSREEEIYFSLANDGLYLCYDSGAYSSSGLVKYENGEIIVEKEESGNAGNGTPVNREMVEYREEVDVDRVKWNIQMILQYYSDIQIYGNTCIYYINDELVFVDNLSGVMEQEDIGVFATGTGAFSLNDELWCYDIEELVFLRSGDDFYVCKYQNVTDPFDGSENVIPVEYYHIEKVREVEEETGFSWTYRQFVPVDSIPEDAVVLTGGIYLEPLKDLRDYDPYYG